MKNRGQTTVLFSCMISVLLLFTLTVLEVGRIYCGRMKMRAVLHSAQSSIMADYHRELFERYHLLFLDPTYGTGSEAMVEERLKNYIDLSLNGEKNMGQLYSFSVNEVALVDSQTILDAHMRLLKQQLVEYEKTAGLLQKAVDMGKQLAASEKGISEAAENTKRNAVELPESGGEGEAAGEETTDGGEGEVIASGGGGQGGENKAVSGGGQGEGNAEADFGDAQEEGDSNGDDEQKVEDPRDILKNLLQQGLIALLLPEGTEVSNEEQDFSKSPSHTYSEKADEDRDSEFQDVSKLVKLLGDSGEEDSSILLSAETKLAFSSYVLDHFSYQGCPRDSVMQCEVEYILKGKDNDCSNLESVLSDIIWLRMPVNYVYLLSDVEKQSEALGLATAICTAAGIMPAVEIVKYLLLGCWAYGESIYEVRQLMHGDKLPYVKSALNWNTDLKTLAKSGEGETSAAGMDYRDYLYVLLAKKESKDITYARMLDLIEKNLKREDENLSVVNLCGAFTIQGRISMNPLLVDRGDEEAYAYSFFEELSYSQR